MATSTVEDYLKSLYAEQQRGGGGLVAMGALAVAMNVAPGTATAMVKTLAEAGINVKLRYVSWTELDSIITARNAQLFGLAWVADIPDPDTFLRSLFYSSSGTNYFRYSDRTVDSLLDVAQRTANPEVRMNAYRSVEMRVVKAAPLVPLFHSSTFVGLKEDVSGLEVNPLGISTLAMEKLRIGKPVAREPRQALH